jgi:hypothetical protein
MYGAGCTNPVVGSVIAVYSSNSFWLSLGLDGTFACWYQTTLRRHRIAMLCNIDPVTGVPAESQLIENGDNCNVEPSYLSSRTSPLTGLTRVFRCFISTSCMIMPENTFDAYAMVRVADQEWVL